MLVADRHGDVDHREDGENRGLDDRHQRAQNIKNHRDHELGEIAEDLQHQVVAEHVAEETDRERDRPEHVGEELDQDEQRRQQQHRPHELLEVLEAVLARAEVVIGDEDDQAHAEIDEKAARRRREAGDQAEEIPQQDEKKQAAEQRHVFAPLFAEDAVGEADDDLHQELHRVPQIEAPFGNHRIAGFFERPVEGEGERDEQDDPHDGGEARLGKEADRVGQIGLYDRIPGKGMLHGLCTYFLAAPGGKDPDPLQQDREQKRREAERERERVELDAPEEQRDQPEKKRRLQDQQQNARPDPAPPGERRQRPSDAAAEQQEAGPHEQAAGDERHGLDQARRRERDPQGGDQACVQRFDADDRGQQGFGSHGLFILRKIF